MNLFSISTLILCLSGIVFSFIIYRSDKGNKVNRSWFYSCVMFSLWALGLTGVTLAKTPEVAFSWQYLLDISAIFLPYFYFIFVLDLLNLKSNWSRDLLFIIALILSIFSFTGLFKTGMIIKYGFHWVDAGPYYYVFLLYFIFYAILTLGLLLIGYMRAEKGSILRAQIRNTIFGGIMGYGGGVTNFFPQLFSIYPYGNYLVILYIVFMVYGVLRYKILSAKVVSAQIFSTALILISLFNLLKTESAGDWFLNFFIFAAVNVFSLFLIRSVNQEVRAREALAQANSEQENLIHIISHQIKGYLAKGRNVFAELLSEPSYGPISDTARPMIDGGFRSLTEGVEFTEQILNAANVEKGNIQYQFDEINMKDLVMNISTGLKPIAERKKIDLVVKLEEGDFRINADKMQLSEAIKNIIENSINYTPTGSISINLYKEKEDIKLSVKDTGVGIAPDDMKKLFTKGGRGKDSLKINVNSTGYGLFFVKKIIDAHGGTVNASSEGKGKGATFVITLPVQHQPHSVV